MLSVRSPPEAAQATLAGPICRDLAGTAPTMQRASTPCHLPPNTGDDYRGAVGTLRKKRHASATMRPPQAVKIRPPSSVPQRSSLHTVGIPSQFPPKTTALLEPPRHKLFLLLEKTQREAPRPVKFEVLQIKIIQRQVGPRSAQQPLHGFSTRPSQ
jgi:hypothetical protein